MSGVRLAYNADLDEWERQLAEAERRAQDLTGLHGAIGEVLLTAIRRNMLTSGDGTWPPLKQSTLEARARAELGAAGALYKRGRGGTRVYTAAAARAVSNAKPLILSPAGLFATLAYDAGPDHVDAGSNLPYAAHQFLGSLPGWRWNIPARNPLYLHPEDEREIEGMYTGYFAEPFA